MLCFTFAHELLGYTVYSVGCGVAPTSNCGVSNISHQHQSKAAEICIPQSTSCDVRAVRRLLPRLSIPHWIFHFYFTCAIILKRQINQQNASCSQFFLQNLPLLLKFNLYVVFRLTSNQKESNTQLDCFNQVLKGLAALSPREMTKTCCVLFEHKVINIKCYINNTNILILMEPFL